MFFLYIHPHIYKYIHICIYTYSYADTYTYTYTYKLFIYKYIHTHMNIRVHIRIRGGWDSIRSNARFVKSHRRWRLLSSLIPCRRHSFRDRWFLFPVYMYLHLYIWNARSNKSHRRRRLKYFIFPVVIIPFGTGGFVSCLYVFAFIHRKYKVFEVSPTPTPQLFPISGRFLSFWNRWFVSFVCVFAFIHIKCKVY